MLTLAKLVSKNLYLPIYIPSFLLKIIVGEMSEEVLKSTNVSSEKIIAEGFNFKYPNLEFCFKNLIENKNM
jgi:NAD dependent epimerase/dehydratase family enzyme